MKRIPLTILPIDEEGCHVMVRGKINGLTANMLIDTGATRSVLDLKRSVRYSENASLIDHDKLFTGVGVEKIKTQAILVSQLQIGSYILDNYKLLVINLDEINNTYASLDLPRIDMVIGGDILWTGGAIIDYTKGELVFLRDYDNQ